MTQSPDIAWKIGDPIHSPLGDFSELDPQKLDPASLYKVLIGAVVPRPIAFVSTVSPEGLGNLAPFSFFNGVSSKPLALVLSVTYKADGTKKDTLINIESTGEFVVNSVNRWILGPMHQCSGAYPYGVDEMKKVGLTPLASTLVKAPRVKESALHFECRLLNTLKVGEPGPGASTLVVGEIIRIHANNHVYKNGKIDLKNYQPVARLAGSDYALDFDVVSIPRPVV